jgi:hypothetical protein
MFRLEAGENPINVRVIGRSQNMEKDPALRIKDCRKVSSRVGPIIRARINGARSYFNFLKK